MTYCAPMKAGSLLFLVTALGLPLAWSLGAIAVALVFYLFDPSVMMMLVSRRSVMGEVRAHGLLKVAGWSATAVMALVVAALLWSWALA